MLKNVLFNIVHVVGSIFYDMCHVNRWKSAAYLKQLMFDFLELVEKGKLWILNENKSTCVHKNLKKILTII